MQFIGSVGHYFTPGLRLRRGSGSKKQRSGRKPLLRRNKRRRQDLKIQIMCGKRSDYSNAQWEKGKDRSQEIESVHVLKEKEDVVTGTRDERKATQEKSKGEAEMAKKTCATGDKESKKKRFIECSACGMRVSIQGVI